MSKPGKVLIIAGLLFWLALYAFRLVYGGWHQALWVPLVLGTALLIVGLIKEGRAILDFFTMRTTKHGFNMGAVILMTLVGLTCLNILAVRYNKRFDTTPDRINSLSDQSIKAAQHLEHDTQIVLLYRQDEQSGASLQRDIKVLADRYSAASSRITFEAHDAIVDPGTASKYDFTAGASALFVRQGDRKVKVDQTTEEGITRALIKLGRPGKKILYFTTGHGERELDATDADGLSFLKEQLSVVYDVRPLTLYTVSNKVPTDAAAVAVIRPTQQFLEAEIHGLREYVQVGQGKLLIAIDPGTKQNLSALAKSFGIEFENNFVMDVRARLIKMGPATVLGSLFPEPSDITKAFGENMFAVFQVASALRKAPDAPTDAKVSGLIATPQNTMATSETSGEVEFKPNGPHNIGMTSVSGKSEVIVFGDSEFLANAFVQTNLNNDLAQNSFAELANDKDLISIRPRTAAATQLDMSRDEFKAYSILFLLPVPLLLFLFGGILYWRRRTA